MPERWIGGAVLVATLLASSPARSQDSASREAPWHTAVSFGLPTFNGELGWPLFTVGANFTRMANGVLSPDFSIGTVPLALSFGMLPIGMRGGLALPMRATSGMYVVPSAGFSMITAFGATVTGVNAGIALVSNKGERVGITWHRFSEFETFMLIEVGGGPFRR